MKKYLFIFLALLTSITVFAQTDDIEIKYQQALIDAYTREDPSTYKGYALADYYKSLIAAGVSVTQAIERTKIKFRELRDYDFYAGFQFLMKVPDSGLQAMRSDLNKQEQDWTRALADRVTYKYTTYPIGVPKPGTGTKGTAVLPKSNSQQNVATVRDDGKKELDAGNEAYKNKDYATALKLFHEGAAKGNSHAIANIGLIHAMGNGVTQNSGLAKNYYQQAIDKGNAFAMYRMGLLYVNDSLLKDDDEAFKWFLQSAEKGNDWGQVWAGYFYEAGRGTVYDFDKALDWYKKSADKGNSDAKSRVTRLESEMQNGTSYYNAGKKYYDAKQYKEALPWLIKAAEKGSVMGAHRLGLMHTTGNGVAIDTAKANQWYLLAAEKGHIESQHNLGVNYYFTNRFAEALPWFKKAAEQGYTDAINNVGAMYHNGKGVPADRVEAIKWYKLAAEKGAGISMYNLGVMYENGGTGVQKDLQLAKSWYEKALAAKYPGAQDKLESVNKAIADQSKAVTPAPKPAAPNYHPDPAAFELYNKGKTAYDAKNYTEALEWFLKAADGGDIEAMYRIGVMYDFGYGVKSNLDEAIYWYEQAEALGHKGATEALDDIYFYGW